MVVTNLTTETCQRAASWQNQRSGMCALWRLILAWASAQSDQSLRCALNGKLRTQVFFIRTAKTLIRLGGSPGWSESSLGAHAILLVLSWGISNGDEKPLSETYTWWRGTFYLVLLLLVRNLTPRHIHGRDKPCITLISVGEKPYIWIYSCCWQTLFWNLLILMRNLTNRLTDASEKSYTETHSLWWQTLHRGAQGRDKSYTGTYLC